jgi:hypothetical protein
MPSSQSFSRIQRRISDSPDPACPENSGDPDRTIPTRDPAGFMWESMCCRNSSDPSETRGRPAPKRPWWPCFSCSSLIGAEYAFQSTP